MKKELFGVKNQSKRLIWRWVGRILLSMAILAVIFWSFMYYVMNWHIFAINKENVPQFIQAHFVDVDKLTMVSKYRSGIGHDASSDGEDCRSMRHYHGFNHPEVNDQEEKAKYRYDTYSPVNGRIMSISGDESQQMNIRPDDKSANGIEIRIDNVSADPSLKYFSKVKAGQKIGESLGMAEITITYNRIFGTQGFSYYELLPDYLFDDYQKAAGRNITRDDFIISKEYRDAHPLQCEDSWGQWFIPSAETESDYNYVYLNGYIPKQEVKKDDEQKNN